jgi:hypothetical protein
MELTTEVKCPYCGHKNKFIANSSWGRILYNCFIDEGRCDGSFVIEYKAHITATVKTIEGEEKYAKEKGVIS